MEKVVLILIFIILPLFLLRAIFRSHSRLPPSPAALPVIGHFHLLGPILHRAFHELSLRHGPLFSLRLGSVPCVVASSPALALHLLKTTELCFTSRLRTAATDRLCYASAMAFAPYGPYWNFIRGLTMRHLLGPRPVAAFAPLRARHLRLLLARLAAAAGPANLTRELQTLSVGVIAEMVLGSSGMGEDRLEEARLVVRDVATIFGELNLSDFVWLLRRVDVQGFRKRVDDIFRRLDALLETVIGEREELRKNKNQLLSSEKAKDFLDILLDHLESEDQMEEDVEFTRLHLKGLVVDLFIAGTDTTAASTEWALAELINHPTVLEKARKEIDEVVGKRRVVSESDIPNLPYIQALTKEVLRLHPPVPLVMRRSVKECKVGEHVIPESSVVVVNTWAIARDPQYWDSPTEFRPERFLEGKGLRMEVKGQQFELLPFGSGRRICPGTNMALQTLPTLVAALIQCFDFEVVGDFPLSMEERPGITVPRLHHLVCLCAPRDCQL